MRTQPKVSIIVPVYNVEPYLRQCLDSIVNQTIRDIQIICVNDGSTDGSRAILQKYADRDSRIEIIDQQNQGGGSARNAAYPHIKGEYAYFADPDDWLDIHLCEKALRRIEETNADVVYFRALLYYPNKAPRPTLPFNPNFPDVRIAPDHRHELLDFCGAPWRKFWKSAFLLRHQILFSAGKRPHNDVFQNWKGCILAERIAILHEPLYHQRRLRLGSYQTTRNLWLCVIVETMNEIGTWLKETGQYDEYREFFLLSKLLRCYRAYRIMPYKYRKAARSWILGGITDEDRKFLRTVPPQLVQRRVWLFYKMLEQPGIVATAMFQFTCMLSALERFLRRRLFNRLRGMGN
jgi:glycosyltransferase involved in cell wall biosynthesis